MADQHFKRAFFAQLGEEASAVMTQLPPERTGLLARIAAGDALPSFRVQVCGMPKSLFWLCGTLVL